jgi:hypothetical protein
LWQREAEEKGRQQTCTEFANISPVFVFRNLSKILESAELCIDLRTWQAVASYNSNGERGLGRGGGCVGGKATQPRNNRTNSIGRECKDPISALLYLYSNNTSA